VWSCGHLVVGGVGVLVSGNDVFDEGLEVGVFACEVVRKWGKGEFDLEGLRWYGELDCMAQSG